MFDLGDELIIESYRIPWLIWIQLLVMLLLIILLYIFALDLSQDSSHTASSSAASTALLSSSIIDRPNLTTTLTTSLNQTKVGEEERKKGDHIGGTSTSRRSKRIIRGENIQERECSSTKEDPTTNVTLIQGPYHPCHFLGLATQAFLKCLGLDSTSENPSNTRHGKDR